MSDFRDKLKQIRADERPEQRIPLTDEELGLNDGAEEFLRAREALTRHVEALMRDFIEEGPSFAISHGFFEGKYSISLSCDELCKDSRGEVDKCFSRLNILLSAYDAEHEFEITSKLTVLSRDLPKASVTGTLADGADDVMFREFVEAETLRFAREYFSQRHPAQEAAPTP